jgi:hypothetical protein
MENPREEGVFLALPELRAIYPRLKTLEGALLPRERTVFLKIESILYKYHSVEEIEGLFDPSKGAVSP